MFDFETIREDVISILDNELCLSQDMENGLYKYDVYMDYGDTPNEKFIKKLLQSDDIMSTLSEHFYDGEDFYNIKCEVLEKIVEKLNLDDEGEESVFSFLDEVITINYPYDFYLDHEVKTNIMLNTGDLNYDFTLNNVYPSYNTNKNNVISSNASIFWLAKQQGYKKDDLNKALIDGEFKDNSVLLFSIRDEIHNLCSHMNALTFVLKMSVKDLWDLNQYIEKNNSIDNDDSIYYPKQRKGNGYIILDKKTNCGLFDKWQGSGSVLDITLEKDVEIPMKYIWKVVMDGTDEYGIDSVYGMMEKFWNGEILKIKENTKIKKVP